MIFLVDTNVLIRLEDSLDPRHLEAISAIERLKIGGHECHIVPQVLYEFWVVATRPIDVNGLGLDPGTCEAAIREWMSFFRLRLDERGVFRRWADLVSINQVRGKVAHDARLVAAMQRHRLTNLLTFNAGDFVRFSAIDVFTPNDIVSGKLPS